MVFEFEHLLIKDVILVKPEAGDTGGGFFTEVYKKSEFCRNGICAEFNQDNHSRSTKGVLRGLHYQAKPKAQAKLVRCIKGAVFDVAVDLRKNSETFGKWIGEILSEENRRMLFITEGFAHGFVVLSDEAELLYSVSGEYSPQHDRGIRWDDPDIGINWGIYRNIDSEPIVSDKDAVQPFLKDVKDIKDEDLF